MKDAELARELYNKHFESFSEQQTAYLPLRAFRTRIFSEYHERIVEQQPIRENETTPDRDISYPHFLLFELAKDVTLEKLPRATL